MRKAYVLNEDGSGRVYVLDSDHGTVWKVPGPGSFYDHVVAEIGQPEECSVNFIVDAKKSMLNLTTE